MYCLQVLSFLLSWLWVSLPPFELNFLTEEMELSVTHTCHSRLRLSPEMFITLLFCCCNPNAVSLFHMCYIWLLSKETPTQRGERPSQVVILTVLECWPAAILTLGLAQWPWWHRWSSHTGPKPGACSGPVCSGCHCFHGSDLPRRSLSWVPSVCSILKRPSNGQHTA